MGICCANCNKQINEGDECIVVKDNFLLFHYFEVRGNVFCDDECLKNYLSADDEEWNDLNY